MDKSRICVTKTANLAKDACSKKHNLLVYERKQDPCEYRIPKVNPKYLPRISPAKPKQIRICTGAELKKMCPPRLCKCPTAKSSGILAQIWSVVGLGVKGIFAIALFYWTYDIGLWGPSEETEKLYKGMCNTIAPMICPDAEKDHKGKPKKKHHSIPKSKVCKAQEELKCVDSSGASTKCCQSSPSIDGNSHQLKEYYNKFVVCCFDMLVHGPERVAEFYDKMVAKFNEKTTKPETEEEKREREKKEKMEKDKGKKC